MRLFRSVVISAAIAAFPALASAQANALAGEWRFTSPVVVRNPSGGSATSTSTSTVTLTARGDSVSGTIVNASGVSRPLRGVMRGTGVVLEVASQGQLVGGGDERAAAMITTYTLTLRGDSLSGSVSIRQADPNAGMGIEGLSGMSRPVVGVRARG